MPAFYYLAYLIVSVLVAYFVYRAYVRLVEKRAVDETSGSGAPVDVGLGALIGLVLVAVTVIFLWAFGSYAVLGVNTLAVIFVSLANDGAGVFVEEVILRGIVSRITEERLGTWVALAISVVLFALLHLASPGATVYRRDRGRGRGRHPPLGRLRAYPEAVAPHRRIRFGWDFSQDAIFGIGKGAKGLLQGEPSGPALLSGESAGIEGSVVALVLCLVVSAFLLAAARRRGNFVGFGGDRRRSVR